MRTVLEDTVLCIVLQISRRRRIKSCLVKVDETMVIRQRLLLLAKLRIRIVVLGRSVPTTVLIRLGSTTLMCSFLISSQGHIMEVS